MRKKILKGFLPIAISLIFLSFELPTGWIKADSLPKSYDKDIDLQVVAIGIGAGTIMSVSKDINVFETIKQMHRSDKFKGINLRMSRNIKSEKLNMLLLVLLMSG